MENTCGDPGDALSGRKNIWFRLRMISRRFLSHSSIPHSFAPLLSLFKYHMENLSSPQSKARKKKSCLDCSSAAVVIDRDIAVFILKCWTKQIAINLPVCIQGEIGPRESREECSENFYGSNNVNGSSGWFQEPSRIKLEVLMPVNGDFIQLP